VVKRPQPGCRFEPPPVDQDGAEKDYGVMQMLKPDIARLAAADAGERPTP